jgi:hypothetical protein
MRRFLILLLACILPLKAATAYSVAIAGPPAHEHASQAVRDHDQSHAVARPHCVWMAHADDDSNQTTPAHDHPCPHLGMVSIATALLPFDRADAPVAPPAHTPTHFSSITLDVPRPPPTLIR